MVISTYTSPYTMFLISRIFVRVNEMTNFQISNAQTVILKTRKIESIILYILIKHNHDEININTRQHAKNETN